MGFLITQPNGPVPAHYSIVDCLSSVRSKNLMIQRREIKDDQKYDRWKRAVGSSFIRRRSLPSESLNSHKLFFTKRDPKIKKSKNL